MSVKLMLDGEPKLHSYKKYLIPARNSRHRTACLALYRALLRLAPQISLPDNLATGWGPGKNPVAIHIERAFRRNVADTSPRIVYPALQAGYRMLSVLHDAAKTPSSKHHASIVSFLEERLQRRHVSQANRPPAPPPPKEPIEPLLVRVPQPPTTKNPNPAPQFVSSTRPLPASKLGGTGERRVPRLDMAGDIAFLRITKPQPEALTSYIRSKTNKRLKVTNQLLELSRFGRQEAGLEDQWERDVAELASGREPDFWFLRPAEEQQKRQEGQAVLTDNNNPDAVYVRPKGPRRKYKMSDEELQRQDGLDVGMGRGNDERSYEYTLQNHSMNIHWETLRREREVQVARADAMRRLIKQETALAEAEEAYRYPEKWPAWAKKMVELHGEEWRSLFPGLGEGPKITTHTDARNNPGRPSKE